jgi:hypothetical protein
MLFSTLPLYPHWGRKTVIVLLVTGKFLPVKASAASLTFGWDGNIPVEPNLPQVVGQAVYQVVKKVRSSSLFLRFPRLGAIDSSDNSVALNDALVDILPCTVKGEVNSGAPRVEVVDWCNLSTVNETGNQFTFSLLNSDCATLPLPSPDQVEFISLCNPISLAGELPTLNVNRSSYRVAVNSS